MITKKQVSFWVGIICLGSLVQCTNSNHSVTDPKQSVTHYIEQSFSVRAPDDKLRLMKFLTGDVKSRLASWSEDQFREAFIDSKRQFIRLLFKDTKEISPTEVEVTYELTYMDRSRSSDGQIHEAKITNKKLSQLIFSQGRWLIADVHNIKELVEYTNELSIP